VSRDDIKDRRLLEAGHVPEQSFKVLDPDGNVVDVTANPREWPGVSVPAREAHPAAGP
jgi:hypothetical protein